MAALLCLVISSNSSLADAQGASTGPAPTASYSFGDTLALSALGGKVPSFTLLSIWNFTDGWLQPWVSPPVGELHLQRGGWVNTDSAFFSRELDPTFSFNAGTSSTRDEYIGAVSLFVPLNRRLQIGLIIPFIDSLQRNAVLPTENSFGDVIVAPQLMLGETETRSVSAIVAIRTPAEQTSTGNGKTIVTPTLAIWQDLLLIGSCEAASGWTSHHDTCAPGLDHLMVRKNDLDTRESKREVWKLASQQ